MTLEEAKQLKEGQEIWYRGLNDFPEKVVVSKLLYNQQGKLEIHLVDNCYIPERDLKEYVYLTFNECAEVCKKNFQEKLDKLKHMMELGI